MRSQLALCLLLTGCEATDDVLDPAATDGGADGGADAGAQPDAAPSPRTCPEIALDTAATSDALIRLGFGLAGTALEGRAEVPQRGDEGWWTTLRIDRVWRGHSYLVGRSVRVPMDPRTAQADGFPQVLIASFAHVGLPRDLPNTPLEGLLAAVPETRRALVSDLLAYRAAPGSQVGVIELVTGPDERAYARLVQSLGPA